MESNRKLDPQFFKLYTIGLSITFFIGCVKILGILLYKLEIYKGLAIFFTEETWLSWGLLLVAMAIMIFLFYEARKRIRKNDASSPKVNDRALREFYKEYIQLEGYIQTLIGFFIAILSLIPISQVIPATSAQTTSNNRTEKDYEKENSIDFGLIAFPIGVALTTSILGWYFGSYIAPPGELSQIGESVKRLNVDIMNLSASMVTLSQGISETEKRLVETTDKIFTGAERFHETQEQTIKNYNESLEAVKRTNTSYSAEVQETLNRINTNLNEHQVMYENSLRSLNENVHEIQMQNQLEIKEVLSRYFAGLNKEVENGFVAIQDIHDAYNTYLKAIQAGFGDVNSRLADFMDTIGAYNKTIISNTQASNDTLKEIAIGINNIEKTVLNDIISELAERLNKSRSKPSSQRTNSPVSKVRMYKWYDPRRYI